MPFLGFMSGLGTLIILGYGGTLVDEFTQIVGRAVKEFGSEKVGVHCHNDSGLGVALYAGWWLLLPADTAFQTSTPGAESATRGGRRPGVRRRLGDVGPLIVLAALGLGAILLVQATLGQGAVFWSLVVGVVGGVVR